MHRAKQFLAASLGVLWLLPSVAVCLLGLHLALEHHAHHDPGDTPHAATSQMASQMAEVVFHGHHHEEAESAEHSHDVTFSVSKLPQRAGFETVASSPTPAFHASTRLRAKPGQVPERASPPLFTAHCSLLI